MYYIQPLQYNKKKQEFKLLWIQAQNNYHLDKFNDKLDDKLDNKLDDKLNDKWNDKLDDNIKQTILKLGHNEFIQKYKNYAYLLNQIIYDYWKKIQLILMNKYNKKIQTELRSRYKRQIVQYHKQNIILAQQDQKPIKNNRESQLFIYPFQNHQTFIKIKKQQISNIFTYKHNNCVNNNNSININNTTNNNSVNMNGNNVQKKQLIVFVHGYQASSFDMQPICNYLKYNYQTILTLLSTVNEGRTQQQIQQSAHRLAIQVKNHINSLQLKDFQISFICHSLGGIIGRACLKYLQLHKDKFNHFVSLCSPHLGYLYHSSTLISTSLWILNKVKKDASMLELTMQDNQKYHETYLYKLSQAKELSWFNQIWLFGSKQDQYVPYWSAILQQKYFFFETQASKIYKTMLESLHKDIQHKINRIQLIFNQKAKDLSNFIGRTAHIKILNYTPGIQLFYQIFCL